MSVAATMGAGAEPGGAARPLTRREKLANTRAAIMNSALENFARKGFEGASTREIAHDAGVQHGMIRHAYGSKEQLWREALLFLFERLQSEIAETFHPGKGTPRHQFRAWLAWYIAYCARHPEHGRLMVQQSILEGPQLEWAVAQFLRERQPLHYRSIERLKATGDLPDVDTASLYFMITAACQMPYLLAPEVKATTGRDVFAPDEIARHAEAVAAVFLR